MNAVGKCPFCATGSKPCAYCNPHGLTKGYSVGPTTLLWLDACRMCGWTLGTNVRSCGHCRDFVTGDLDG